MDMMFDMDFRFTSGALPASGEPEGWGHLSGYGVNFSGKIHLDD
jgi:hypothetical protein